ncbi:hypothetical protein [Noviherbaspirillum aerium]|uniref:hypothetical protein n=1 Tax=Noviherbaspirillum aerium TaxID=2588497 RepID=UPI00124C8818|nr:hypothetical protein [Noviherbaspirillum aerium]
MTFRIPPRSGLPPPRVGESDSVAPSSSRQVSNAPDLGDGTWTLRKLPPVANAGQPTAPNPHTFAWSALHAPVKAIGKDGLNEHKVARLLAEIRMAVKIQATESYAQQGDSHPPRPDGARTLTYTFMPAENGVTKRVILDINAKNRLAKCQLDLISGNPDKPAVQSQTAQFGFPVADLSALRARGPLPPQIHALLSGRPKDTGPAVRSGAPADTPRAPGAGTGGPLNLRTHADLRNAARGMRTGPGKESSSATPPAQPNANPEALTPPPGPQDTTGIAPDADGAGKKPGAKPKRS